MPSRRRYLSTLAATVAGCTTSSDAPGGTATDTTRETSTDSFATATDPSPAATQEPPATDVASVSIDHPAVVWAVDLPQSVTWAPAVTPDGSRLFVGVGGDPNDTPDGRNPTATGAVVALSARTGDVDWYERTEAPVADDLQVHEGRLHAATGHSSGYDGVGQRVAAYDFDGSRQWQTDVLPGYLELVAAHDGTTFVATSDDGLDTVGERLYAFDGEGSIHWDREVGDASTAAVVGDRLLYDHTGVELGAYDLSDGTEYWRVPGDVLGGGDHPIATADGLCFTRRHVDGQDARPLAAYSLVDGTERWRYSFERSGGFDPTGVASLDGFESAPALVGVESGGTVFALDEDGAEQWRFETGEDTSYRVPVVGDSVYLGTRDGTLYALDPASGDARWRRSFPGRVSVSTVAAGLLVSTSRERERLLASVATDGTERWRYTTTGRLWPRVVADDALYVVSGRTLVAFDLAA